MKIPPAYRGNQGEFCLPDDNWRRCREQFNSSLRRVTPSTVFYFYTDSKKKSTSVRRFLKRFEKESGISEGCQITAHDVPYHYISVVVGKFWSAQRMRFQLLTILLRCGLSSKWRFKDQLFSHEYTRETREAVLAFMSGRNWYSQTLRRGWRDTFINSNTNSLVKKDANLDLLEPG